MNGTECGCVSRHVLLPAVDNFCRDCARQARTVGMQTNPAPDTPAAGTPGRRPRRCSRKHSGGWAAASEPAAVHPCGWWSSTADGRRYALKMPLGRDAPGERTLSCAGSWPSSPDTATRTCSASKAVLATASGPGLLLEYAPGRQPGAAHGCPRNARVQARRSPCWLPWEGRWPACTKREPSTATLPRATSCSRPTENRCWRTSEPADCSQSPAADETGTPGFMAPDRTAAAATVSRVHPAADVYALGALGWFMLTGQATGAGPATSAQRAAPGASGRAAGPAGLRAGGRSCPSAAGGRLRRHACCGPAPQSPWTCCRLSIRGCARSCAPPTGTRGPQSRARQAAVAGHGGAGQVHPWDDARRPDPETPSAGRSRRGGPGWLLPPCWSARPRGLQRWRWRHPSS